MKLAHPFTQPFTINELQNSLDSTSKENSIVNGLTKYLDKYNTSDSKIGNFFLGIEGSGSVEYSDSNYFDNYSTQLFGSYSYKNFNAFISYTADTRFMEDSLYFGSIGKFENNITGRLSNAYFKYSQKHFNLFYGRNSRNYGLFGTKSLILSDNPFSFDHLNFELFNNYIKYSFSTTRLDDIYGYDIRTDSIPSFEWKKRYISFHRIDFSLADKIKIGLSESVLYGGTNQTWVPMYLNPANIFFLNKMSDRRGINESNANVLMSLDFLYRPLSKFSFYFQFLLDDMDFTKSLRAIYPDRIGVISKIIINDLIPNSMLFLYYARISNWTYNSFYTFGNYTFVGKSLGYPQNGHENLLLGFNYFKQSKFVFSLKTYYQQERKQDLDSPFIGEKTKFPIGIPQESIGSIFEFNYFPNTLIDLSLKLEYIQYNNFQNINKNSNSRFAIYFVISMKEIFSIF